MLSARIKSICNNVMRADAATNGASMHENMRVQYCRGICSCSSAMLPAPRCPLRTSRVCNKIMRADGVTDGANVHAFLVRMSMRAPAESCVHEPALKYCTRSPLMVSWHGYVSMATGDCRNITRTDTHGYGLRVQVRPYRAAGTRRLGLRQNWTASFEE